MRGEVVTVLSEVFRVPVESIENDSSPDTITSWDSFSHLEMVSALEGRYAIRFNMREIQKMDTPERIEAVLVSHGC